MNLHRSRWLILLLPALLAVVAVATSWQLSWQWALQGEIVRTAKRLSLHAQSIDNALGQYRYIALELAHNDLVQQLLTDGNSSLQRRTNQSLELDSRRAGSNTVFILDASGKVVATSDWQRSDSLLDQTYHQRPYFQQALEGQASSFYAVETQGKHAAYYFAYPIHQGQQLIGAAVVRIDLEPLQQLWGEDDSAVIVSDGYGVVVLSSRQHWRYHYLFPLFDSTLQQLGEQRIYGDKPLMPLSFEITPSTAGNQLVEIPSEQGNERFLRQGFQLPQLNWTVHYLANLAPVYGFANNVTFALLMIIMLIALGFALLRERRLKRASRAQTRDLLQQSSRRQQTIINNTNVGLMLLSEQGDIRFLNRQASHILKLDTEHKARTFNELIPEPDWQDLIRPNHLDQNPDQPLLSTEIWVERHDEVRIPLTVAIRAIDLQPDAAYLVTIVDISRRKAAESQLQAAKDELELRVEERTRELQEAQQELIQASKLAALGEMSTSIAHEFNQPLTAIRTYLASSQLLLEQGKQQQVAENLQLLKELTERTSTIANQLKTFTYNQPTERRPVNLSNALQQVLPMFRQQIEQYEVELTIDHPPQSLFVAADSGRIQLVLTNLIKNALEALQHTPLARLTCEFSSVGAVVKITISDNAGGIETHHLNRLFDPFFTTKTVGKGLGLGLSIVAGFIRDLQGSINAENNNSGGATFTITLPLYDSETEHARPATHYSS